MQNLDHLFALIPLIPLAIFGYFAWRCVRYGGLVGALLGGRAQEIVGEVTLSPAFAGSRTLKVQKLDIGDGASPALALVFTSRTFLSVHVAPVRISRTDARAIAELLTRAAGPRGGA